MLVTFFEIFSHPYNILNDHLKKVDFFFTPFSTTSLISNFLSFLGQSRGQFNFNNEAEANVIRWRWGGWDEANEARRVVFAQASCAFSTTFTSLHFTSTPPKTSLSGSMLHSYTHTHTHTHTWIREILSPPASWLIKPVALANVNMSVTRAYFASNYTTSK